MQPQQLSLDAVLSLTGRQVVAAVESVRAELGAEIAARDARIAELEEQVAGLSPAPVVEADDYSPERLAELQAALAEELQ